MKILVYGAGVLGSLFACRLIEAGHEVSVLARGQRLADLQQHGLVMEDMLSGRRTVHPVQWVEQLKPEDAYDLVLVIMGKHQVASVLPPLAANRSTPNVLFMGNNATGAGEMVDALGAERVLLGFPLAGGTIKGEVVCYGADVGPIQARAVIGEINGAVTPRTRQVARVFESAGFRTEIHPNMDAWLKSHAAAILPVAAAYFAAGEDTQRLARTRDALVLMVRSIREGLRVLQAGHIPITPGRQKLLAWLPEPLLVFLLSRLLRLRLYQLALAHGSHARAEMQRLSSDFHSMARAQSVPTPNLDILCTWMDPRETPLEKGSAQVPMDWRAVWAATLALLVMVFGYIGWRNGRARWRSRV